MTSALLLPTATDIWYRPGGAYSLRLTGPAGWLGSRAFTVEIDGDTMVDEEDGDDLVITVPSDFTAAHPSNGGKIPWTISEVGGNVVLAGWWRPSDSATTHPIIELPVTLGTLDIAVTLVVGPTAAFDPSVLTPYELIVDHNADLAAEVTARNTAISSAVSVEATARNTAIGSAITTHVGATDPHGDRAYAAGIVGTEATARAAADTVLSGRVAAIEGLGDLATQAELDAEAALARNANNLTSGTVNDARIPAGIARDTEVTTAVANEATARDAAIAAAIAALVNSAPGVLDTLNEIATALGDDPNFAATMTTALAGKQAASAELTTLAGQSSTAAGRSVMTAANYGAIRTLLSLVVGTDVQAWSAVLDATTSAFTTALATKLAGIATGATANSPDATLLDRANHTGTESADVLIDGTTNKAFLATERTKLAGIATGATANSSDAVLEARANHTGTQTLSTISDAGTAASLNSGTGAGNLPTTAQADARYTARAPLVTTITSSATPTFNTDSCDVVNITALAAAITSMVTNKTGIPAAFQKLLVRIKDDGTARAITWGADYESCGATLPTTTIVSKRVTAMLLWSTVTSKWGCVGVAYEA